ncbi:ABC transporter ATP-binding protein [uncultured Thiothrix sp.]|uniref:ABC transporter ATP-binding protein n=1 Tax=uncultured Thiothrix sp. TaxID=223185 RepID=UPI00260F9F5D|nr:ABC transporter ATP-binding protein [uncultured Thiothrix sp.]
MLSAHHLHYAYPEAGQLHTVLKAVNLELALGEQVALVGSSGSGKSTLLNLLGGIDKPASGQIFLKGQEFTALKEPVLTLFRRQNIGFIYQQFNLIPTLTVAENILLPLSLLSVPTKEQQERLAHWLAAIQLPTRASAFPDQLSGGEQQRVAIARALIHQPALVLADEPTGNLDAKTGQLILDLLFKLAEQAQQTLLVVTHSKAVAERAERILVLQDGVLQTNSSTLAW